MYHLVESLVIVGVPSRIHMEMQMYVTHPQVEGLLLAATSVKAVGYW